MTESAAICRNHAWHRPEASLEVEAVHAGADPERRELDAAKLTDVLRECFVLVLGQ